MSWPTVSLGSIVVLDRDGAEPSALPLETRYVGLEHIESDGTLNSVSTIGTAELKSTKFRFDREHILYGKLRPYLRKIARPDFRGVCSTDIIPIRLTAAIDRGYLFHFLRSPEMVALANSRCTGANLPRLNPSQLEAFEIPLPPFPEQHRIAAILDAADVLRAKRRESIEQLDSLIQATFLEMFGDPVTNPKGWGTHALGDLGEWRTGGTPSRNHPDYFAGDVPWFSSGELNSIYVAANSKERITESAVRESAAKWIPVGSLMLGMYDTAALKASITSAECTCNQAIAFSSLHAHLTLPLYVYSSITVGREHFRRLQRGVRQKNLNLAMIRAITIPSPPLALQDRFASIVESIEQQKIRLKAHLAELDALFSSLQSRAFNGELVA